MRYTPRDCCVAVLLLLACGRIGLATDDEHRAKAETVITEAVAFLRTAQDSRTGGWGVPPEGSDSPHFPAVTGLVINGMLLNGGVAQDDAAIVAGVRYLLAHQQPDGGIYDTVLPSYNTSIALSALAPMRDDPVIGEAIRSGQAFLKGLQWSEDADPSKGGDEAPSKVDEAHAFYGGIGYGKHARPDMSNLNLALQAFHDTQVSPDDASFQRAIDFLERCQMLDGVNEMPYAKGSKQGGFIYATAPNAAALSAGGGLGQSQAGTIEETLDDGTVVSRLRAYGSMTYAGFKGYVYANLDRDDERVVAAYDWIRRHYTLDENPGMGDQGLYYYYVTFARGLDAWGVPTIDVIGEDGAIETRDWGNDLIDRLATLQEDDGSFRLFNARWMEDEAVLVAAYALIALRHAAR